jgi:UPF0042 nucleotide-binding protein
VRAIVLTGVSGSGKSTAIKALEDVGYFCIDNLPVQLLETFLLLCDRSAEITRVAVVMDVRERHFATTFRDAFDHIRSMGLRLDVVFLDASDDLLIRRFSETRREHPLGMPIEAAIERERRLLADLREQSTHVIDTTSLTVHDLKRRVQEYVASAEETVSRMRIGVYSFGYKYGLPREAHYVFDVRFVPNPYFDEALRPLTGADPLVQRFIEQKPESAELLARLEVLLDFLVPLNEREGKALLTIAVGCTGGRHRSVFFAERLGAMLREKGQRVSVFHRDVERG